MEAEIIWFATDIFKCIYIWKYAFVDSNFAEVFSKSPLKNESPLRKGVVSSRVDGKPSNNATMTQFIWFTEADWHIYA